MKCSYGGRVLIRGISVVFLVMVCEGEVIVKKFRDLVLVIVNLF